MLNAKPVSNVGKRWLCLWLPNWPIQRQVASKLTAAAVNDDHAATDQAGPDRDTETSPSEPRPLILWHTDPRRGRVVAAACCNAIRMGVRLGMPVAQANDLAAQVNADFLQHDRDTDRRELFQLARELQAQICPVTAVETLDRFKWPTRHRHDPEAILCEIQGVTHLFDGHPSADEPSQLVGEPALLAATATLLRRRNLYARMAIADTLGAAWALANTAISKTAPSSPVQSTSKTTFEFFIAPPGQTTQAIASLPTSALRIAPRTMETLDRLGVETIGHLMRLPRNGLATRLGADLLKRISQATGDVEETMMAIQLQSEHAAALEMEYPTDAIDLLSDRLQKLIDEATADLRTLRRGVLRLCCRVDMEEHPSIVLQSGLFAPTLDQDHLARLMISALEGQRLASKVTRLSLAITQHSPLTSHQPSILQDDVSADGAHDWTRNTEAARLIDSLAGRLGEDAVRGVRLTRDPLPEDVVVDYPMTAHRLQESLKKQQRNRAASGTDAPSSSSPWPAAPHQNDLGRRPLELLPSPVSVTALGQHGEELTPRQFPSRFRIRGRCLEVASHWGPERIETQWWRGPMIRRDYFRVEFTDARRLWLFRDLTQTDYHTAWFWHGTF